MKINANIILELLLSKHAEDLCVPECKTGPTQGANVRRIDMWVMKRSWVHPNFIGYEIKVSRGDFINDNKWHEYMDYCSEFSFVCPSGLIDAKEVPQEAGLLVTSTNGTKLFTKKKAPYRTIDPPVDLLLYVLMSRCKIAKEYFIDKKQFWLDWLANKINDRTIGHTLGGRIGKKVKEMVIDVQRKNEKLEDENRNLQDVKKWCEEHKVDTTWGTYHKLETLLEEHEKGFSHKVSSAILNARRTLDNLVTALNIKED